MDRRRNLLFTNMGGGGNSFTVNLVSGETSEEGLNLYNYLESTYGDLTEMTEINAANNEIIYVDSQRILKYWNYHMYGNDVWSLISSTSIFGLTKIGKVLWAEPLL